MTDYDYEGNEVPPPAGMVGPCLILLAIILMAALLLLWIKPAEGGCVQSAVTFTPTYTPTYTPYVATKIVTPTVATFVAVPVYTAIYTPPPYTPPVAPPAAPQAVAASQASSNEAQILKLLQSLDARLRVLERRTSTAAATGQPQAAADDAEAAGPAVAPAAAGNGLAVVQTKCAACHESRSSASKGGGFTLLQGTNLAKLSDKQVNKLIGLVYRGKMPPPKSGQSLTDQEVAALIETFTK